MATTLRSTYAVGQLVTVHHGRSSYPGTLVAVRALRDGTELRIQVLTDRGVFMSRHVVDAAGREREGRDGIVGRVERHEPMRRDRAS